VIRRWKDPVFRIFKNELKNLAGMIGDFEVIESVPPIYTSANFSSSAPTVRFRSQESKTEPKGQIQPQHQAPTQSQIQEPRVELRSEQRFEPKTETYVPPLQTQERQSQWPLERDLRSENMIQEVKNQFNLSHEDEAIRLLIATGYHQLKGLLKR
jgi:hypothetical protein